MSSDPRNHPVTDRRGLNGKQHRAVIVPGYGPTELGAACAPSRKGTTWLVIDFALREQDAPIAVEYLGARYRAQSFHALARQNADRENLFTNGTAAHPNAESIGNTAPINGLGNEQSCSGLH